MTTVGFTESIVELAALEWFERIGYTVIHGPDIAPDGPFPERSAWQEVILARRLEDAVRRLNPNASNDAITDAIRRVGAVGQPSLVLANRAFHTLLVDGLEVEVLRNGQPRGEHIQFVDFDHPEDNEFWSSTSSPSSVKPSAAPTSSSSLTASPSR